MVHENKILGSGCYQLFDDGLLNYFLPEMCAISEMQTVPADFSDTGFCFVFTVYLTYGVDVELGFESEQEGRAARKNIISGLSMYWGPDKLIFANGLDFEVAIVPAVLSVTDVFAKDGRSSFSVTVNGVPYPINLIFLDILAAEAHHRNLLDAVETYRRQLFGGDSQIAACG